MPLCSTLPLRPLRNESKLNSVPQRLLRFHVPLTASLLESGTPGLTSPGIFRPWPFSNLRRFAPPATHLFCFTQIPPMGFKEQTARCVREPTLHPDECSFWNHLPNRRAPKHPHALQPVVRNKPRPSMAKPFLLPLRQHVTHHTTCKQITREEGTSTWQKFRSHRSDGHSNNPVATPLTTQTASRSHGRRTQQQLQTTEPTTSA